MIGAGRLPSPSDASPATERCVYFLARRDWQAGSVRLTCAAPRFGPTLESCAKRNTMDESNGQEDRQEVNYELKGKLDAVSYLYVIGGIPCMIAFFLILFGLVGACDRVNTYIPA